jgi:hypothetical protein
VISSTISRSPTLRGNALCRPSDIERVVRVDRVVKLGWMIPALIVVAVLAFIAIEIWFGLTQAR